MSENDIDIPENDVVADEPDRKRGRWQLVALGALIAGVLAGIIILILFQTGAVDNMARTRFTNAMAEMGIAFEAEAFRIGLTPTEIEFRNATFRDKLTGEKLFFVREGMMRMTILEALSLNTRRDVNIDSLELTGLEAWVRFDENGRSNFANLRLPDDDPSARLSFKFTSSNVVITESVVYFGDEARNISATGRDLILLVEPQETAAGGDDRNYKISLRSANSTFVYDGRAVNDVTVSAEAMAHSGGADISRFELTTPIGSTSISGTIRNWEKPTYDLDVTSTVNLAQANEILVTGTTLAGVGNFTGKISGEGETYRIDGEIMSDSLTAAGVTLRGMNVNANATIRDSAYEANGTALARMLTFEDFTVNFLKLAGNVRGTGYDFNWIGELEAAAARSPNMSIASLFLSDARAEYKDRQLRLGAGSGRAGKFTLADARFSDLRARGLSFSVKDDSTLITAPSAQTAVFETDEYKLQNVTGSNVRVFHKNGFTDVDLDGLRASSAELEGNRASNLSVATFRFRDEPSVTNIRAERIFADNLFIAAARVDRLEIPAIDMQNTREGLTVYADKARVAKIDADAAVFGSMNIGGVRLTVRRGTLQVTTNDIDAGTVAVTRSETFPEGGELRNVRFGRPIYTLEPSGRYRASADMTLGGGLVGDIDLGTGKAKIVATNGSVAINDIDAEIMGGRLEADAAIAVTSRDRSAIKGRFENLDASKLLALLTGSVIPVEGNTDGTVDLTFAGRDGKSISGTVNADIEASAGSADRGLVPMEGKLDLNADNGLFTVNTAYFRTADSLMVADGRVDIRDNNTRLDLRLSSTNAAEVERIVRVTGLAPALEEQLDSLHISARGRMDLNALIEGRISDPSASGKAMFADVTMRGRQIGTVTADYVLSPEAFNVTNGLLRESTGGSATFSVKVPRTGENNIAVTADLKGVNAGNLLAALPFELPERISDLRGAATGSVKLEGLPDAAKGSIDIAAANGTIAGQNFDSLKVNASFEGMRIDLTAGEIALGSGKLGVKGNYDRATEKFDLEIDANAVPVPLVLAVLPRNDSIPDITGRVDGKGSAKGTYGNKRSYEVTFNGRIPSIEVGGEAIGGADIAISTKDGKLFANVNADLSGRPQVVAAEIDLNNESLPFTAVTEFDNSPIAPFLAFIPQLKDLGITGTATGRVEYKGNIAARNDKGEIVYSADALEGTANFTQLALLIRDTPLNAVEPINITFNTRELNVGKARFSGGGSNMAIAGTKALSETAINNLAIEGRVNLNLVNLFVKDTFFAGYADTKITLIGPNRTAKISGTADIVNGSVASFIGSDRFTADRIKGRLIFTSDQVELESATGYLGGGKFTASGGGILEGLSVKAYRLSLVGDGITVPLPKDFITTGDANLEITGIRRRTDAPIETTIAGRVFAQRSLYSRDIDLANVVGGRRDPVLSGGGSAGAIRFDLIIEGRDALVVRNNIADLTASVSLVLTGDAENPILAGRITANSGTILFRKDRYEVQRGVLEFPPNRGIDPVINLQAESTIAGYQVYVNLSGPLKETELLVANVRSSPALPQADVVSLITTGTLANTAGGIPTLAQTGINTAAEVIADSIINTPVRKATDKLFGLNVFEIDPIISGRQANPAARLTVGRQINNNLRVTYSTNLSQDQNQVLAFEYRVSNRLSFVAQYEQRSLTNVTRNRDNFSFEVRLRKRF
ncbi:MAG: translocation/assembly module TamB domain-containing protein [Acidobacteriota bacterium]|nr:MAG: translocation/assembly module TamB domain-containing protein [Acidobacteriota bacterium]